MRMGSRLIWGVSRKDYFDYNGISTLCFRMGSWDTLSWEGIRRFSTSLGIINDGYSMSWSSPKIDDWRQMSTGVSVISETATVMDADQLTLKILKLEKELEELKQYLKR